MDYVQNLEKVGLLEKKEMTHLHNAVQVSANFTICNFENVFWVSQYGFQMLTKPINSQTDLKKLLRNPPLVKIPKITEMISSHPLMGALPPTMHGPLESSTKESMKVCGSTLYKEGFKPNGIWLISNGIVKVIIRILQHESRTFRHEMFYTIMLHTS